MSFLQGLSSNDLARVVEYNLDRSSKTAAVGLLGKGLGAAKSLLFGAKAKAPVTRAWKPSVPKAGTPPSTVKFNTSQAQQRSRPVAAPTSPTIGQKAWGATKAIGGNGLVQQGGLMFGAPYVYDKLFGGNGDGEADLQMQQASVGQDHYAQFSNYAAANPQYFAQANPGFHQILSTPGAMRQFFNGVGKTASLMPPQAMPTPTAPQQSAAEPQQGEEHIPDEQLQAAKELLLKDEMNGELEKWKTQHQKRTMDRLKNDPDGAAVMSFIETKGQAPTPDLVKTHGAQLQQQYQSAIQGGEMRPFSEWVSDMIQPQADNFAFDAGVARRKMAAAGGLPSSSVWFFQTSGR